MCQLLVFVEVSCELTCHEIFSSLPPTLCIDVSHDSLVYCCKQPTKKKDAPDSVRYDRGV
jgi:hypothetical protein